MDDAETLLQQLRRAREKPAPRLLERIRELGLAVVPALSATATEEVSDAADANDAVLWAPIHAIRLLGQMGAAEAAAPLVALLERDNDWLREEVPIALGAIGAPAVEPLRALLFDHGKDEWTRGAAAAGLSKIAAAHPGQRERVVGILTAALDPAETRAPEDESVNAYVISELADLKAVEALPAMRAAYAEDRVDDWVIGLADVEDALDVPPEERTAERPESRPLVGAGGLDLWLRCKACGYSRRHDVAQVLCDLGTVERRDRGEQTPYDPYVIPQPIVCPKCGVRNQYELDPRSHLTLSAEMLRLVAARERGDPAAAVESPLTLIHFGLTDGRQMYRAQIEEEPRRADLRVRYGNVLRAIGEREAGTRQYHEALRLDPARLEALANLAQDAADAGKREEALHLAHEVVARAPQSHEPAEKVDEFVEFARALLADPDGLISGAVPRLGPTAPSVDDEDAWRPAQPVRRAAPKIGRNDPCWCGSGKRYKKCHGR